MNAEDVEMCEVATEEVRPHLIPAIPGKHPSKPFVLLPAVLDYAFRSHISMRLDPYLEEDYWDRKDYNTCYTFLGKSVDISPPIHPFVFGFRMGMDLLNSWQY